MFAVNGLIPGFLRGFALLTCLLLLLPGLPATAVVIRHDKSETDAIQLGKRFEAAGKVLPDGGCTLIAPTWAVTAAHVARSIRPGSEIQFGDKKYSVKRVVIHPKGVSEQRGRPPEVDLALIELEKEVEKIKPAEIYRGDKELGETLFIVGYGDYGNAKSELKLTDGKRRAVTNVVDDAGPRRIFMKFDEPPAGTEHEGVGAAGDSGGPAFLEKDGKLFVAGVSSGSMNGKPGQYGVIDVYTRVGSYIDWIEKTMNSKEEKPVDLGFGIWDFGFNTL